MNWTQLSPDHAKSFIDSVKDDSEKVLFNIQLCEVYSLPIAFYEGYELVRILNRHMMPYLVMDYLSNGEDHYYLDGSESVFHNLNAQRALSLDENNVLSYLDFYISYVYERGNSLNVVREGEEAPTQLIAHEGDVYNISALLSYQGKTSQTNIEVEQGGAIHVKDSLKTSFLTELKPGAAIQYRHKLEDKVIEDTKALLGQTATGKALLEHPSAKNLTLKVLNSINYQGFTANTSEGYITMPAVEQNAKHTQALVLAYVLRDVQQLSDNFTRQPYTGDRALFVASNHVKNLDMIEEMCRIVDEYEEQNVPEALQALTLMDLEDVYAARKKNIEGAALMEVYLQSLSDKGLREAR